MGPNPVECIIEYCVWSILLCIAFLLLVAIFMAVKEEIGFRIERKRLKKNQDEKRT